MSYPTKVEKYGAFWTVSIFRLGSWVRCRDLFSTRREAREARTYWSNY